MQVSTGSQGNAVREERGVFKAKAFPGKYEASLEFPAGKVGEQKNSLWEGHGYFLKYALKRKQIDLQYSLLYYTYTTMIFTST